jgi:hypothetical protein
MHIVREREKRVTGARHPIQLRRPLRLLLHAERLHRALEQALPLRLLAALEHLPAHEQVDRVRLLRALDALLERQREDARVVPQPPDVGLAPGEARAVDARLLARAEADERAVLCVRDAVGLGVLERERREDEVRQRVRGKLGEVKSEGDEHSNEGRTYLRALGNDVVEEGGVDLCVVPALLEMHTVHLLGLDLAWDVSWVNLGPR